MLTNMWVIVAFPGSEGEHIFDTYPTWSLAMDAMDRLDDGNFDIMKRSPDGSLTTDY